MSYQSVLQNKTLLTAAQLKSLVASPVLLIPGQAGCVIDLQSVYFRYIHGSVVFNPGANDVFVLYNGTQSSCLTSLSMTVASGFIDQTVDQSVWSSPSFSSIIIAGTPPALALSTFKGAGAFLTQYNSAGTFPAGTDWTLGNGSLLVFLRWAYVPIGEI